MNNVLNNKNLNSKHEIIMQNIPKLILLLGGLFCAASSIAESDTEKETDKATRVTSKLLSDVAISPQFIVPASAVSMNDSKLSAEVRATVKNFPVLVGDIVKRGEVLIELDNRDHKLNLLRAQVALKGINSRLSLVKYQLDQAKSLSKENAISDEKLQQRKAEVRSVKAEKNAQKVAIAIAERDLEKCTIYAPFDAIITERIAQVGELASPGSPLIRVIDASRIEVSAKLQAQDISALQLADSFQFVTKDKSYDLTLRQITPAFDPVQRNREARFLFSAKRALPGATGTLQWQQSQLYIPANLIVRRGKQLGVFTIEDKKASFVALENAREGSPAQSQLSKNTPLIIDGRFSIQDGTLVKIDEE